MQVVLQVYACQPLCGEGRLGTCGFSPHCHYSLQLKSLSRTQQLLSTPYWHVANATCLAFLSSTIWPLSRATRQILAYEVTDTEAAGASPRLGTRNYPGWGQYRPHLLRPTGRTQTREMEERARYWQWRQRRGMAGKTARGQAKQGKPGAASSRQTNHIGPYRVGVADL